MKVRLKVIKEDRTNKDYTVKVAHNGKIYTFTVKSGKPLTKGRTYEGRLERKVFYCHAQVKQRKLNYELRQAI